MLDFIHLTDLHILPRGEENYGLDPAARLRAAVASIAQRHGPGSAVPAAFAVITGDLTHHGQPEAYAQLSEMLAGLPMPCHLMLGNHDERDAFRAAFPMAPVDAAGFVQQAFDTPAGRFILLDTKQPGTHAGRLCAARLTWLRETLAGNGGPVFLFLHHPPLAVGINGMDRISLENAEELAAVLEPYRARIRHLFHGHLHRPLAGSWLGIPLSSLRGTAHQVALDLTPRDSVPGSHEPPAYALVRVSETGVVVHTHDFLDTRRNFEL